MKSTQPPLSTPQEEERRLVRPFFALVVVSLLMLYSYTVLFTSAPRDPLRLVIVTALFLITGALHWLYTTLRVALRHTALYLVVQGLLCFVITLVGDSVSLAVGLYMMLIGEALGSMGLNWRGFVATAYFLTLSATNFYLLFRGEQFGVWALTVLPTIVFVIIFVWVFHQKDQAREEAQNALRELDTAHRQLAEYAAQVEDLTLTNERQRMARELHDTLSQGLAGLVLQLEAIDSHLSRNNVAKAQAITQQAMERARSTLADARRAIDDLRSGKLIELDLETAVRQEADRFTAATGITCDLMISLPSLLPGDVRDNTLRVVAEALTNVARYAQAQRVTVNLYPIDQSLAVEVCDDGTGFDPAQVGAGHYGLIGLRERTRLSGGTLNVESAPGQGTTLKVYLPLKKN